MELGASWRGYGLINWSRLARAKTFFAEQGYSYFEVPWAVSRRVAEATMPENANPLQVGEDAILVGSAEQGFLDLALQEHTNILLGGRYFSISPCFRGEPVTIPGHTQLSFMKVELFWRLPSSMSLPTRVQCYQKMMRDAKDFMTAEGAQVDSLDTKSGEDLNLGGIEVGSYGLRSFESVHWAYGTGLAEPRFSTALALCRTASAL